MSAHCGQLVLAGRASAAVHPGESPLGDPLTGLNLAALGLDPADDLHREPQDPLHRDQHGHQQAQGVHDDVALMPSIFLAPSKLRDHERVTL
jgi:hypothetical protein